MNDRVRKLVTDRLRRVVDLHFDPAGGSRYWLERARELGFDPRQRIRSLEDIALLGRMDERALASRPVEDFLPASIRQRRPDLVVAETGGTTGESKFAVFREDEFREAFVEPFVAAAARCGFPRGESWLFLGPTGPHIIGKAARACARALGSPDPFMVDFDPRWARALADGSFAKSRYLHHLEDQALRVVETQHVGVLFTTPPVLDGLSEKMSPAQRQRVRGIHFGGLPLSPELRARLVELFPHAVLLSGYGNTLLGMMPELDWDADAGIGYFAHGTRLVVTVVRCEPGEESAGTPLRPAGPGERGRVLVHRLDETQFLANMLERDTALELLPAPGWEEAGFVLPGVREPLPVVTRSEKPKSGFY
jgi:hypothetical protein